MKIPQELGQINIDSEFGKLLYSYAYKKEITTIVEIGTWNGCGSTYCINKGIFDSKKDNTVFYSLESNPEFFSRASDLYNDLKFCKIIHGRILEIEEIPYKPEFLQAPKDEWLRQDLKMLKTCPNVIGLIPSKIDLLLLDGGEFTSYIEYLKLKDKVVQYIALDDTFELKNKEVEENLLSDKRFTCEYKGFHRNGWSLFRKG